MKGKELLRKLKKLADRMGVEYKFNHERGKGSHGTVYIGEEKSVIPNLKNEIKSGTLKAICKQLKIKEQNLSGG